VLSVAEALSEWADVTLAFRNLMEPVKPSAYRVIAIEPNDHRGNDRRDDTATRGFHPLQHLAYCHRVRAFARSEAHKFDVVLEKGWRLSGLLAASVQRAGVPAALGENLVSVWLDPLRDPAGVAKYALHRAALTVTNTCSRQLPVVIAETDELKEMLVTHRGVAPERIEVVGLGVDHRRFRPSDQAGARADLGIDPAMTTLLYVGGIDEYHDLEPVIDALGTLGEPRLELHVVGDGAYRARTEQRAAATGAAVRFHGHVRHDLVPQYIAAADLCIAPYRSSAFHGGLVTFSTLKIPEYMACARPVVSIPSPAIQRLITHGRDGFLVPNDAPSWQAFLGALPDRTMLAELGAAAAAAVSHINWRNTAWRYFVICDRLAKEHAQ
jgi:glycosyltransferase involved in cell wall biosynthesis